LKLVSGCRAAAQNVWAILLRIRMVMFEFSVILVYFQNYIHASVFTSLFA